MTFFGTNKTEPEVEREACKPKNFFDPNYFDTGQSWQAPNLRMSEAHYSLARDAYWHDDREIIDCTVDGKLTVYRKESLEGFLVKGIP